MEEKPKKKWYKTKIGIFFIILFLPIAIVAFGIYLLIKAHKFIWNQNWKTPYRLAAIAGLWVLLLVGSSLDDSHNAATLGASIAPTSASSEQKVTAPVQTTIVPTIKATQTPTATIAPTQVPVPTVKKVIPTKVYIAPTAVPATHVPVQQAPPTSSNTSGASSCNCSLTCPQMTSCSEAQYQLNTCGCSARDGDHDGIACDSAPLHCQN
jgi:hypothetical protein